CDDREFREGRCFAKPGCDIHVFRECSRGAGVWHNRKQRTCNLGGSIRIFPHSVPVGNNGKMEGKEKEREGKGTQRASVISRGKRVGRARRLTLGAWSAASGNKTKKECRAESWGGNNF
ncbi:unnamed protein product, partial [Ixodes persulcatus]